MDLRLARLPFLSQTPPLTISTYFDMIISNMVSRPSDTTSLQVFHTKLGPSRRVALPAAACQEVGLRPGDPVAVEVGPGGIRLLPFDRLIEEIQDGFADCRVEGVNASDELIAERRAEATREAEETRFNGDPRAGRP